MPMYIPSKYQQEDSREIREEFQKRGGMAGEVADRM